MRAAFTLIHRWAGLFIAVFLFIAGLTGAVISWDHELDEWLNPHLYDARTTGTPLSPYELVRRVESRLGRAMPDAEPVPRGRHEPELAELLDEMTSVRRSAPPGARW